MEVIRSLTDYTPMSRSAKPEIDGLLGFLNNRRLEGQKGDTIERQKWHMVLFS
jgi:hypothetical protein